MRKYILLNAILVIGLYSPLPAYAETRPVRVGIFPDAPLVLFASKEFTSHTVFDLQGKRVAAVEGSIFTTGFVDYVTSFGIFCDLVLTKDNEAVMRVISSGSVKLKRASASIHWGMNWCANSRL